MWLVSLRGGNSERRSSRELTLCSFSIRGALRTYLKWLLMDNVSDMKDLEANLAEIAAQCEGDYAYAEQFNINDKSELMASVANAKAVYAAMLRAVAEREATQGFWRKWGAVNRATRACINLRSAQALVRIALRKAEDQKIISSGGNPNDPQFAWMHRYSEAETYLL
jgi:hypothetical protein